MFLSDVTLKELRELINERPIYRSGPQLVNFFNKLGFHDKYEQGFPSRWLYTDEKLKILNGTPELDKCMRDIFNPQLFIGKFNELDQHIVNFNQYLAFDGWQVIRDNKVITFHRAKEVNIDEEKRKEDSKSSSELNDEDLFLNYEFKDIELDKIPIDSTLLPYLKERIAEIKICLSNNAPLSVIFLAGSTLEGILLGIATQMPAEFNKTHTAPKDDMNKVKKFDCWTLNDYIETAHELGILKEDVKKFSIVLRDFRNYIHPHQQMCFNFHPDQHTAKLCFQVLKVAIYQINNFKIKK